jgi:lipopolysaccharide export system permease protein
MILILALAALGLVLCALLVPGEKSAVSQQLLGFPDSDVPSQLARPLVLTALCFLPALGALVYSFGTTLDRYMTRQFLGIFGICLSAFFMIWLLIDMSDKITEFRNAQNALRTMTLLLLLPYSLLLALLHALGKLSSHREIISMIQSGRGILRVTLPLLIAGVFCTLLALGLNYHWAPTAEGTVDDVLEEASGKQASEASQVLYLNPADRRLWMIGRFPADYQKGKPLLNVGITTTDEHQMLVSRLSASRAVWDRNTRQWTFDDAVMARYSKDHPPEFQKYAKPLVVDLWSETPWQLIKPGLSPTYMGIPDLNTWIKEHDKHHPFADSAPYLSQWHYRWALPFTCLITVLLATPLGIHFSRRGPGGGIFLAVALSAVMLLVSNVILALGEAGTLHPALAAWLPNILFGLIGAYLFRRRITGRPIYHTLQKRFLRTA